MRSSEVPGIGPACLNSSLFPRMQSVEPFQDLLLEVLLEDLVSGYGKEEFILFLETQLDMAVDGLRTFRDFPSPAFLKFWDPCRQ